MRFNKTKYGIIIFIGSLFCVVAGVLLSLREPGNGKDTYRKTHDLLPLFGVGVCFILIAFAWLLLRFKSRRGVLLACLIDAVGAILILLGGITVSLYPGTFSYLMVSGFLFSVAGFILTGVTVLRHNLLSSTTGYAIVFTGIILLFFNDQYTPWMATVLGLASLWLSYFLAFKSSHLHT